MNTFQYDCVPFYLVLLLIVKILNYVYFLTTGNIPLPKREERAAMLKHSEF